MSCATISEAEAIHSDSTGAKKRRRAGISKSLRFKVFHRDGFVCQYCGLRPPDVVLELDHIRPHSKGGDDSEINLITSCEECNRGKSDKVLSERAPRPDADLAYLEVQQEIAEARRFIQAKQQRDALKDELVSALKGVWNNLFDGPSTPQTYTVVKWLEHFAPADIAEGMKIAARRNARSRIGDSLDIQSYVWGILHRMVAERDRCQ